MPRLSAWMVRLALIYLWVGFTLGATFLTDKGIRIFPSIWRWLPIHIEFLVVGWLIQLALGIAFWILPRRSGGLRGNVRLATDAFVLLNMGILLVAVSTTLVRLQVLVLTGRILESLACLLFGIVLWSRIKAFADL